MIKFATFTTDSNEQIIPPQAGMKIRVVNLAFIGLAANLSITFGQSGNTGVPQEIVGVGTLPAPSGTYFQPGFAPSLPGGLQGYFETDIGYGLHVTVDGGDSVKGFVNYIFVVS